MSSHYVTVYSFFSSFNSARPPKGAGSSLSVTVDVCFCLFVCLFVCPFVCLFVCLFFCLFVCLFICLSVYLFERFGDNGTEFS